MRALERVGWAFTVHLLQGTEKNNGAKEILSPEGLGAAKHGNQTLETALEVLVGHIGVKVRRAAETPRRQGKDGVEQWWEARGPAGYGELEVSLGVADVEPPRDDVDVVLE